MRHRTEKRPACNAFYLGCRVPSRGRAARVLEQQHLVVAQAVDVEGAEQVTQLGGQGGQSLEGGEDVAEVKVACLYGGCSARRSSSESAQIQTHQAAQYVYNITQPFGPF